MPDYSSASYPIRPIIKRRELPLPGDVMVAEGDEVTHDTELAKITLKPGIPWVIPLFRLLGVEPEDTPDTLLVDIGEQVETGQVIARAKAGLYGQKEYEAPTDGILEDVSAKSGRLVIREEFGKEEPPVSFDAAFDLGCRPRELPQHMISKLGQEVKKGSIVAKKGEASAFFTRATRAPISGIVTEINDKTGYITISRPFKEIVVTAFMDGTVTEVIPSYGAVVETTGVLINGVFGVGPQNHGELALMDPDPAANLTPDMIGDELLEKVLVVGGYASNEALERALEVGVNGVICATASYLNLVNSLGVKLGVGITGQEDIDMTVILMEGFGELTMRRHAFEALRQLDGMGVSINGRTQIRAGAIRPEIVCPFPGYDGPVYEAEEVDEDIVVGQRVRIVSAPYFGALGEVGGMPSRPEEIETGARVPVARIKLEDEDMEVSIPRKNVEIF
ncbi:MAG: hypothetical protein R6U70_06800 [Bacillota bacterium]